MADNTAAPAPHLLNEGAYMGPWLFTSAPLRGVPKSLCVMTTRTHVLSLRCALGFEDGALVKLIQAAEEP